MLINRLLTIACFCSIWFSLSCLNFELWQEMLVLNCSKKSKKYWRPVHDDGCVNEEGFVFWKDERSRTLDL